MSEPQIWKISPDDPEKALRVLQDADKELTLRLHHINWAGVDQWPFFQIKIYAMQGTRLLSHPDHGDEICRLFQKLQLHGLRGGVRLEIQWR